jgi:hypothetical protein
VTTKKSVLRSLKGPGLVLLFVILLVLPSLVRARYYYRRPYAPPEVVRPDHEAVAVPTRGVVEFVDADYRPGEGRVIVDRIHGNSVEDSELNVLLSRLTTRGIEVASNEASAELGSETGAWLEALGSAAALVVVAPHQAFTAQEAEAVERFVEQGGRVLLMGDPSRYAYSLEYDEVVGEIYVPESDVAALNSLAARFGLAFADDYMYNTAENAGNYQYVILREFQEAGSLTRGLDEVVFYAAHSIVAAQESLITADSGTVSSLSEQVGGLTAMGLGGAGRVLAVGDFTFMTEPYNSAADNNRLIANIADFVAGAARTYGLSDFPYFFGDDIDLVPVTDPAEEDVLAVEALAQISRLRSAVEDAGKSLHWHTQPSGERDTLYVGLYSGIGSRPELAELLARRGITFTLETVERALATPTPTPRYTPTPAPTTTVSLTPTATPVPPRDWIHLPGLGRVEARDNVLYYQNEEPGGQVLVVLTFGEEELASAVQRLLSGDYDDCLLDEDRGGDPEQVGLALCPSEFVPSVQEGTPTPEPGPVDGVIPPSLPEGGVLIVSDDNGEGTYDWWTSAYQFYDIVTAAGYQAKVWSTAADGDIALEDMQLYDAVIWCTGDYQKEGGMPAQGDLLNLSAYLSDGGRLILSGAFLGSATDSERGLLLDLQVVQGDHPLAEGFETDQVITLERFTADEDYVTTLMSETDPKAIVWARGPKSEAAGGPAVVVDEGLDTMGRSVWIGFPLFLMPYEDAYQLGSNAVQWILSE